MANLPVPRQTQLALQNEKSISIGVDATREKYIQEWCDIGRKHASQFYKEVHGLPLTIDIIENHADVINFYWLSFNGQIEWSSLFINKYLLKWEEKIGHDLTGNAVNCWYGLSMNHNLPWSEELLEEFHQYWHWDHISELHNFPWTEPIVCKYRKLLDLSSIDPCCINLISWSEGFVLSNKHAITKWDFLAFQKIPLKQEVLDFLFNDKNNAQFYSQAISFNKSLSWSLDIIEQYSDKLDWDELSRNPSLPWTENFIELFYEKISWSALSENIAIPWSSIILDKYFKNWNWDGLSSNESLPWSENLIQKYCENWSWDKLSFNKSLPWSYDLISKYQELWDWKNISKVLPDFASKNIIERYADKLDWEEISYNWNIKWDEELLTKFSEKVNWQKISNIITLPWTISMLDKFKDHLEWSAISSNVTIQWTPELLKKYAQDITLSYISLNLINKDKELMSHFATAVLNEIRKRKAHNSQL